MDDSRLGAACSRVRAVIDPALPRRRRPASASTCFASQMLCLSLLVGACSSEAASAPDQSKTPAPAPKAPEAAAATPAQPAPSAPAAAPTPTTAPGTVNVDLFCPEVCKRTRQLGCRAAERCDQVCQSAFAQMPCPEQLQPAMECALSQPLSAWICSPDGFGAVKDGPCDREQTAYDACLNTIK